MTRPTLINVNADKYNQGLRYCPFIVNIDKRNGSCNTLDDIPDKICVPNKTEDIDLNIFNITTTINKSKALTKHIPC